MKILIDMNLSPTWVAAFAEAGFEAAHRSDVGDPKASDRATMDHARAHGYVVFTHDLDFGAILAATGADTPSVIQIRTQNVDPTFLSGAVISLLRQCRSQIEEGALVCLDHATERVRILPLQERRG